MKDPEAALEAARRAAASAPEGDEDLPSAGERQAPFQIRRLAEWAIIAPDETKVYSTRRLGQPITGVKRFLIRLLSQYIDQIGSQQSRFNAQLAAHLIGLEERVRKLEAAADARSGGEAATRGRADANEAATRGRSDGGEAAPE